MKKNIPLCHAVKCALLFASLFAILIAFPLHALTRDDIAQQIPNGKVVWAYAGKLYFSTIANWSRTEIPNIGTGCAMPRWSPDGTKIAYASGSNLCIVNSDFTGKKVLISGGIKNSSPWLTGLSWTRDGKAVTAIASNQTQVLKHDIASGNTTTLYTRASADWGRIVESAELRYDNRFLLVMFFGDRSKNAYGTRIIDLNTKKMISNSAMRAGDCTASWAPDGGYIVHTSNKNTRPLMKSVFNASNGSIGAAAKFIGMESVTAGGYLCHYGRVSNDGKWTVFAGSYGSDVTSSPQTNPNWAEKNRQVYIWKIGSSQNDLVALSGKGAWAPDLFVPTGPVPAMIKLQPTSLSFSADKGGTNPAAKNIAVSNSGGGTLTNVNVDENAAWLTVKRTGTGNSQTLENSIDIAGLDGGTFSAKVKVSGGGAQNIAEYTVTLTVTGPPVLTKIVITPTSAVIAPGATQKLTASLKDQNGDAIAAAVTWKISGGGSLAPASSASAQTHTATFTSDGTVGEFIATASSGNVSATANVTVSKLHLKVNCGPNTPSVSGWEQDDKYVKGGTDYPFSLPGGFSTPAGGAPANVYPTVRRGDGHSYSFDVPDGIYLLRLHFFDGHTDGSGRKMRYKAEGQYVIENLNVEDEAGGMNKGLIKEVGVQVIDGNGLQLVCEKAGGDDVFESGIEIIAQDNSNQLIAFTNPLKGQSVEPGKVCTIAWKANPSGNELDGTLWVLSVSTDGGAGWTKLTVEGSIEYGSAQWGSFKWNVPAGISSKECKLMLSDYGNPDVKYVSDGTFSIGSDLAVKSIANARYRSNNETGTYEILSLDGKVIKILHNSPSIDAARIASNLPSGIYFIRLIEAPGIRRMMRIFGK